jgi:F420-0:gamma-glutamyl ligase-like protein
MNWLMEAVCNDVTGRVSSSRVVAMIAGTTLSVCTLVLTPLAYFRPELVTPLTTFGTVLGALAGSGYVTTKIMSGPVKTSRKQKDGTAVQ